MSEAGVDGHYCGSHLANESPGGVYSVAYPQPGENLPTDPIAPTVAGDAQLPWRIIVVGKSLAPIVASTLTTDLVEPVYDATASSVVRGDSRPRTRDLRCCPWHGRETGHNIVSRVARRHGVGSI